MGKSVIYYDMVETVECENGEWVASPLLIFGVPTGPGKPFPEGSGTPGPRPMERRTDRLSSPRTAVNGRRVTVSS